jgi:hypothetical protein
MPILLFQEYRKAVDFSMSASYYYGLPRKAFLWIFSFIFLTMTEQRLIINRKSTKLINLVWSDLFSTTYNKIKTLRFGLGSVLHHELTNTGS